VTQGPLAPRQAVSLRRTSRVGQPGRLSEREGAASEAPCESLCLPALAGGEGGRAGKFRRCGAAAGTGVGPFAMPALPPVPCRYGNFMQKGIELAKEAVEEDNKQNWQQASPRTPGWLGARGCAAGSRSALPRLVGSSW